MTPVNPPVQPPIDPNDPNLIAFHAVEDLEGQIRLFRQQVYGIKAQAYADTLRPLVPFTIQTDQGPVTITQIDRQGNSIRIDGIDNFHDPDFWPWFITNPPLNGAVFGKAAPLESLTNEVVIRARDENLPPAQQVPAPVEVAQAVAAGAVGVDQPVDPLEP